MKEYQLDHYQVVVIGAGHAGIEAALAAARLGCRTALFTLSLDGVANMPCNPSIGGTAKGHLVRELDALGGEMGKVADEIFLQSRMLNRGKGPAVHSLRVQADRERYHVRMKHVLELQEKLDLKQAEITEVRTQNGHVSSVVTHLGAVYTADTVIIATGTYLGGRIFVGDASYSSGPDACQAALPLTQSLLSLGLPLRRFKTGTPARAKRSSIDFSQLEPQEGDDPVVPFSFETTGELKNRAICHIAYTNSETHRVIRENIHRSPLYGGKIEGIGPRYCPSIEDKVMRFPDKERHQIFVEPLGAETEEMYLQGMSSSLPEDVQLALYRTIRGFEHIELMRVAYAIEYDCCDPLCLRPTLETKQVKGLYGAGQFNGTSGYEEAAAQGLVAGINAARQVMGKSPVVLPRSGSYIGTLIDDLVTKGVNDPYRMMTSRSEYRLLLRQDNADQRLTPLGYEIGLISEERYGRFLEKQQQIQTETQRICNVLIPDSPEVNALLKKKGTSPLSQPVRMEELLRRPQIGYQDLAPFDRERPVLPNPVTEAAEIALKYAGYIQKQERQVKELHRWENTPLPSDLDYFSITGLRLEAREKLCKIQPISLGQAGRISGVSPADLTVLQLWLTQHGKEEKV